MCDNTDSSYIVLKENSDADSYYIVKDMDTDSDVNTIILENETTECNNDNCHCNDNKCSKYDSKEFGMKSFDYCPYLDSRSKEKMTLAKCLFKNLKDILDELVNDIIIIKSNVSSYDSKSMKSYLTEYKNAFHKFIKNFQLLLNKKDDCCGLIKSKVNVYKCECKSCTKSLVRASFNNVNCLNKILVSNL